MSDQPEQPEAPDGETVTTPAGVKPPMFVPKHGKGRLYHGGVKGNAGGTGRPPMKLVEQAAVVLGLTLDELEQRLSDEAQRAELSVDELRLCIQALAPYCLPSRVEHSGPAGGPISLEAVQNTVAESLRKRLQTRDLLLHPPASEPPKPAPEPPRGVASVAL